MERRTIYVQIILCEHLRTLVNRNTGTIENTPQHVLCNRKFHARPGEFHVGSLDINARGSFEHLHNRLFALNFENLTAASRTIRKRKSHDFVVRGKLESLGVQFPPERGGRVGWWVRCRLIAHLDIVEDNQRPGDERLVVNEVPRGTERGGCSPVNGGDGAVI